MWRAFNVSIWLFSSFSSFFNAFLLYSFHKSIPDCCTIQLKQPHLHHMHTTLHSTHTIVAQRNTSFTNHDFTLEFQLTSAADPFFATVRKKSVHDTATKNWITLHQRCTHVLAVPLASITSYSFSCVFNFSLSLCSSASACVVLPSHASDFPGNGWRKRHATIAR